MLKNALDCPIMIGDVIAYNSFRNVYVVTAVDINMTNRKISMIDDDGRETCYYSSSDGECHNILVVTPSYMANNDAKWVIDIHNNRISSYSYNDNRPSLPSVITVPVIKFLSKCLTKEFTERQVWAKNTNGQYSYITERVLQNGHPTITDYSTITIDGERIRMYFDACARIPRPTDPDDQKNWDEGIGYEAASLKIESYRVDLGSNGKFYVPNPLLIDGMDVLEDSSIQDFLLKIVERCEKN